MRFIDPFEAEIKRQQEEEEEEELDKEENEDPPLVNPSNDINDHQENDIDQESGNLLSDQNDIDTISLNERLLPNINAIMSKFTDDQMTRFELYRRSRFKKSNMRRLLIGVTGMKTIPEKLIVVVSATAKMFVGDVVETARTVMVERKESGKIRTWHIREAYRRLKIKGKVPKRLVPRRF